MGSTKRPHLAIVSILLTLLLLGVVPLLPGGVAEASSAIPASAYNSNPGPDGNHYEVTWGSPILLGVAMNTSLGVTTYPCGMQSGTVTLYVNSTVGSFSPIDVYSQSVSGLNWQVSVLWTASESTVGFDYVQGVMSSGGIQCWGSIGHFQVDPQVSISSSVNPTDAGVQVTFDGGCLSPYSPACVSWSWSLDGSTVSSSQDYTVSLSAGTHALVLTGCNLACGSATYTETVNPDPTATISASENPTDTGLSVTFSSSVSGGTAPFSYSWVIGGSQVCTTSSCTHSFSASGAYGIDLTVTDSQGEKATPTYTEDVDSTPVVTASENVTQADVNIPVAFSSLASGGTGGYTYSWTLNGVQLATSSSFDNSFSSAGTYTLDVKVTDSAGGTDTASVTVAVEPDPQASVASSANPIFKGSGAVFTASLASGTGVAPYSWEWTVNGAEVGLGSGTTTQLTYSFQDAGQFWVNATVTDADGRVARATFQESVQAGPLTVSLSASYPNADPGTKETVTASPANGTAPYTYAWYVNRTAQSSTSNTLTYQFGGPGGYNVTCVVTDYFGAKFAAEINVTINREPAAFLVSGPTIRDVGVNATYVGGVSGGTGPYTFTWVIAGNQYTGSSVTVSFTASGNYPVQLTVADAFGHDGTASVTVTVYVAPALAISKTGAAVASLPINLTASVAGGTGPYAFLWTFPGGQQQTGASVQATFSESGPETYQVQLSDGGGFVHVFDFTIQVDLYVISSASVTQGVSPLLATFSASVLGGLEYAFAWNFGNGDTSVSFAPEETFSQGNYTVGLTVRSANGAQGWSNLTIESLPPPATATWTPASGISVVTSVNFTARHAWYTTGPYSAIWQLPGGASLQGLVVSYRFPAYAAQQAVTLNFTWSGGTWIQNLVVLMEPATPIVEVTGVPNIAPLGALVSANASGSSSPDSTLTSFRWTFEGQLYFGSQQYIYLNSSGTHDLNLTIEDALGAVASAIYPIQVASVGTNTTINIVESQVTNGAVTTFAVHVSSPGGIQAVQALLGTQLMPLRRDNGTAHDANYTLSLDQQDYAAGTYSLRVIAWNDNGSSNSLLTSFTVSTQLGTGFNLVAALGGPYNFWILVLTIIGALGTIYGVTRKGTVDIDVGGAVLQGKPGKPLVLKKGGGK